jgi:hypothetical protein
MDLLLKKGQVFLNQTCLKTKSSGKLFKQIKVITGMIIFKNMNWWWHSNFLPIREKK